MNYKSKHAVMGMLSKRYVPFADYSGYVKNSKEVVVFNTATAANYPYEKINIAYSDSKNVTIPNYSPTSSYKSTLLVSSLDHYFFGLVGKEFREIREARNKFNRIAVVKMEAPVEEVIAFIHRWNEERGKAQYGWQLHSGYDVNFFEKYYLSEKDNLWCQFYYIGDVLQGYSVVSKEVTDGCYHYLIRKASDKFRNLCLYVDYKMFERIWSEVNKPFLINWGCSSGSVLAYKKKFPVQATETKYFIKFKKEVA